MKAIVEDRPAYLSTFLKDFFNVDVFLGDRISNEAIQMSWNVAVGASAKATLDCVPSLLTDFRDDLPRIDVPTLIIHGDADRLLPLASTAARLPKLIKNSRLVVIPDGPHAINWTHAEQFNPVLLSREMDEIPIEELAAFTSFNAYAGTYCLNGNTVTHHLEVASIPNRVGTDLVRTFTVNTNQLTLKTIPIQRNGVSQVFELVWEQQP